MSYLLRDEEFKQRWVEFYRRHGWVSLDDIVSEFKEKFGEKGRVCLVCGKKLKQRQRRYCEEHDGLDILKEIYEAAGIWPWWLAREIAIKENQRRHNLEKNQAKCELCGKIYELGRGKIDVHHKNPRALAENEKELRERHKISNLMVLCEECHVRLHKEEANVWKLRVRQKILKQNKTLDEFFNR